MLKECTEEPHLAAGDCPQAVNGPAALQDGLGTESSPELENTGTSRDP